MRKFFSFLVFLGVMLFPGFVFSQSLDFKYKKDRNDLYYKSFEYFKKDVYCTCLVEDGSFSIFTSTRAFAVDKFLEKKQVVTYKYNKGLVSKTPVSVSVKLFDGKTLFLHDSDEALYYLCLGSVKGLPEKIKKTLEK